MKSKLTLLLLFAFLGNVAARAARDIVYAARYYAPPGSHRTSHFHLYRINPDGTGKTQLTFSNADDDDPKWSPDGRSVAFTRRFSSFRNMRCLMSLKGGPTQILMRSRTASSFGDYQYQWSPDASLLAVTHSGSSGSTVSLINPQTGWIVRRFVGASDFFWSPNGKYECVHFDKANRIFAQADGRQIGVLAPIGQDHSVLDNLAWSDNHTLVGIVGKGEDTQVYLSAFGLSGQEKTSVLCRWGRTTQDPYRDSVDPWGKRLLSLPYANHTVVYVQDEGNSGTRPDNVYYLADTLTGAMTRITTGQFLVWQPEGTKFCTATARSLADYGKPVNGYQKSLYVSSLQIGQINGTFKNITPGLVWVTAADWRKRE